VQRVLKDKEAKSDVDGSGKTTREKVCGQVWVGGKSLCPATCSKLDTVGVVLDWSAWIALPQLCTFPLMLFRKGLEVMDDIASTPYIVDQQARASQPRLECTVCSFC